LFTCVPLFSLSLSSVAAPGFMPEKPVCCSEQSFAVHYRLTYMIEKILSYRFCVSRYYFVHADSYSICTSGWEKERISNCTIEVKVKKLCWVLSCVCIIISLPKNLAALYKKRKFISHMEYNLAEVCYV